MSELIINILFSCIAYATAAVAEEAAAVERSEVRRRVGTRHDACGLTAAHADSTELIAPTWRVCR